MGLVEMFMLTKHLDYQNFIEFFFGKIVSENRMFLNLIANSCDKFMIIEN